MWEPASEENFNIMNACCLSTFALAFCSAICLHTAAAVSLPVFGDATSTSKNEITAATGKAKNLVVSPDQESFVIFDLDQLPPNYTADNITSARLRLYVSKITKPGDLSFHAVTSAWSDITASPEPSFDPLPLGTLPAAGIRDKGFILIDVTALVLSWIDNPGTNFGIAISAADADQNTQLKLGAREGPALGFPRGTRAGDRGGLGEPELRHLRIHRGRKLQYDRGRRQLCRNRRWRGQCECRGGQRNRGGSGNVINPGASFSTIPGGDRNRIGPNVLGGFAAGRRAQANHNGSFVFSDSTDANFSSTVENQFSLRFLNGLFIANDAGSTKSVPVGTRYRDNAVLAWARVAAGGTLDSGFNIESVVRNSVGKYTITLRSSASSGFSLVPVVTPEVDPDGVGNPPVGAANARFAVVNLFASRHCAGSLHVQQQLRPRGQRFPFPRHGALTAPTSPLRKVRRRVFEGNRACRRIPIEGIGSAESWFFRREDERGDGAGSPSTTWPSRLIDYGFHAPTMSFPVAGTLWSSLPSRSQKAELDRFCDAMIAIRAEVDLTARRCSTERASYTAECLLTDEWPHDYSRERAAFPVASLRRQKYWPPVRRIDGASGDRNLGCSLPPGRGLRVATNAAPCNYRAGQRGQIPVRCDEGMEP